MPSSRAVWSRWTTTSSPSHAGTWSGRMRITSTEVSPRIILGTTSSRTRTTRRISISPGRSFRRGSITSWSIHSVILSTARSTSHIRSSGEYRMSRRVPGFSGESKRRSDPSRQRWVSTISSSPWTRRWHSPPSGTTTFRPMHPGSRSRPTGTLQPRSSRIVSSWSMPSHSSSNPRSRRRHERYGRCSETPRQ